MWVVTGAEPSSRGSLHNPRFGSFSHELSRARAAFARPDRA
ncbi:hypothetical protein Adi01nite_68260 [Amorphoplanes digitatis]|uniref:Uncharacterized protein n=1 Tax=Actinoplanes digitatis TaxID=1868 RepID=A0A7W7MV90_9ACTN|nr:hypothetical protein [Actinoplanes digitatis]GID97414.1 hypothetical protein Adi01nite_68260 [Actinoplanes digitatis]